MTFADDFTPSDDQEILEDAPDYPEAFGVTFTPLVSGITLGILGCLGAGYILTSLVLPVQENYQTLKASAQEKAAQIQDQEGKRLDAKLVKLESEIREAQSLKPKVMQVFSGQQENLDTLLIDLNSFIEGRKAELLSFSPDGKEQVIRDGSLGKEVNGKLKRQKYKLQIKGNFEQTQSIIRNIERLQSLLVVQDFKSKVTQKPTLSLKEQEVISKGETQLETNFTVEALSPLGEGEVAQEDQLGK